MNEIKLTGWICLLGLLIFFTSCENDPKKDLFELVSSDHSKIAFANTIIVNDSINPRDCLNCFNGGGVGIGDFNNDGLSDVVFTGNQVSSVLYLNKGKLVFEDISARANFKSEGWVTGVSVIDINADGLDDIYLNVAGLNCDNNCYNQLFINQGPDENGIPTFTEEARDYGLEDGNYATQSVFFDYDMDGDLDVYIVHNKNALKFNRNFPRPKDIWPDFLMDHLLRNDVKEGVDHPVFTNVSEELGLTQKGFGLGIGLADFNDDQLTDVYVSNDFITEDLMLINKAHKDSLHPLFADENKRYLSHMTMNGMGMDIADINNDGLWDIFVLDMFPNRYFEQKKVQTQMRFADHMKTRNIGYAPQYMRNTLQLSNGHIDERPVKSSEVAFLYGVSSTDWSWAPLMMDFDNDGDKDIYITNGYIKNVIDRDYIEFLAQKNSVLNKNDLLEQYLKDLPSIYEPNFFFEQLDVDDFEDVSSIWTEAIPSLSNGVAQADFDLDGDLDLVVSNINEKAFLLENRTSDKLQNHYLRIELQGDKLNNRGIGSKVSIWNEGKGQHHFQSVIRGYLSSVDPIVHFGLKSTKVDSLEVIWPNGSRTLLKDVEADQLLHVSIESASPYTKASPDTDYIFEEKDSVLNFTHIENIRNEFADQQLLMRQYSRSGPCLVSGDLDGQPGEEIFIGGSTGQPGVIWFQDDKGTYHPGQKLDSIYEDSDALFIDVDNDQDLDLYVGSGGTEFKDQSPNYQDRIYLNNGKGEFSYAPELLPVLHESTGCVREIDIDHDGDLDLFVGARMTPGLYPNFAESTILLNSKGTFEKVQNEDLSNVGMVTDALFTDIDGDGWEDLIVVGEFMPIRIFKNDKGQLKPLNTSWTNSNEESVTTEGWWNCIAASDFDQDGDIDLIAGNQGVNGFVKPQKNYPIHLYKGDFNNDGKPDPVLGQYFEFDGKKTLFPVHTKEDIKRQYPQTVIQFYSFEEFAKVDFKGLLKIEDLDRETLKATVFESCYIENLGDGNFKISPLPSALQVSPINDFLVGDFVGDGQKEVLAVGNDFTSESNYGQFDALSGLLFSVNKDDIQVTPSRISGFNVPGQSKYLIQLTDNQGKKLVMASQNDDEVKVFEIKSAGH